MFLNKLREIWGIESRSKAKVVSSADLWPLWREACAQNDLQTAKYLSEMMAAADRAKSGSDGSVYWGPVEQVVTPKE